MAISSWFGQIGGWAADVQRDLASEVRRIEEGSKLAQKEPESPERPDGPSEKIAPQPSSFFQCPMPVADIDCNIFRKDKAPEAERLRIEIASCLQEAQKELLGDIAHAQASDPGESSASTIISDEALSIAQQKTDVEREHFAQTLTAYVTFQLLHEWAAGQATPKNPENEPCCYQLLVRRVTEPSGNGEPPPSVWEVYKDTLGSELDWFSYAKAFLFYQIFYNISGFLPTLVEKLLESVLSGCREHLSKDQNITAIASKILLYTERYLARMNGAIKTHLQNEDKTLDECKEAALVKLFQDFDLLITEDSAWAVDTFLPFIEFFSLWKDHSFFLLSWFGKATSFLMNSAVNSTLRFTLKEKLLPSLFRSAISHNITEASVEKIYVFSRGLYKITTEKIEKFRKDLENQSPTDKHHYPPIQMSDQDDISLTNVSGLLITVFDMPKEETPQAIEGHRKNQPYFYQQTQKQIKGGIIQGGKVALSILHDPLMLEEFFASVLTSSYGSLRSEETFTELVERHNFWQKRLTQEVNNLCHDLVSQAAIEGTQTEPQQKAAKEILDTVQLQTALMCDRLRERIGTIQTEYIQIQNAFRNKESLPEIGAFKAFKTCCDLLQKLNNQLYIETIAEEHRAITAQGKKSISRALQPIREQVLEFSACLQELIPFHNSHYLCFAIQEQLLQTKTVLDCLGETIRERESEGLAKKFPPLTERLWKLANLFKTFDKIEIPQEAHETIKREQDLYLESLKRIDASQQVIQKLQSLIAHPDGLIIQRVLFLHTGDLPSPSFHLAKNFEQIEEILKLAFTEEEASSITRHIDTLVLAKTIPKVQEGWRKLRSRIRKRIADEAKRKDEMSYALFRGSHRFFVEQIDRWSEEIEFRQKENASKTERSGDNLLKIHEKLHVAIQSTNLEKPFSLPATGSAVGGAAGTALATILTPIIGPSAWAIPPVGAALGALMGRVAGPAASLYASHYISPVIATIFNKVLAETSKPFTKKYVVHSGLEAVSS